MTTCVRILSTCSVDSSPSILLVSPDGSKILVNCGEGCQRCFLEHAQRVSTIRAVCLTHLSHRSVGGLPGMILTMSDVAALSTENLKGLIAEDKRNLMPSPNIENDAKMESLQDGIDLVGPHGTQAWLHTLRHFMRRDKFLIKVHEGAVSDLKLGGVQKKRKRSNKKSDTEPLGYSIRSLHFHTSSRKRSHPTGNKDGKLQFESSHDQNRLCFLFTTPPIQGRFQPEKAAELGVPKGPLFARLKAGHSVTFIDSEGTSRTVTSNQVVTPSSPGVSVLILSYESDERGAEILSSDEWAELFLDRTTSEKHGHSPQLEIVIHMAPSAALLPEFARDCKNKRTDWMVEHLFVSTSRDTQELTKYDDGTPFLSAATGAISRALINADIYRVPRWPQTGTRSHDHNINGVPIKVGLPMLEYTLVPRAKRGFTQLALPGFDELQIEAQTLVKTAGALEAAKGANSELEGELCGTCTNDASGGELIFAGTGSAMPCKHRNVTGMALKASDGRSMLLDVGEGTIGHFLRMEIGMKDGPNQHEVLSQIRAVWISHPHADHHLGLLRLLHDRAHSDPLLIFTPTSLIVFLQEYEAADPAIKGKYVAIDCKDVVDRNSEADMLLSRAMGFTSICAVPVSHCRDAYAVILDGTPFGRLVYSGDCRPSKRLAQAAHGADVLIHESTFEDGLEAEALLKRHSTVGEALNVGKEMQSKCVILTHFSQRYPKIPPTPAVTDAGGHRMPVIFAFDYMRLTPQTLRCASKLTPALRLLYPEEDEMKTKTDATAAEAILSTPGLFAQSDVL